MGGPLILFVLYLVNPNSSLYYYLVNPNSSLYYGLETGMCIINSIQIKSQSQKSDRVAKGKGRKAKLANAGVAAFVLQAKLLV